VPASISALLAARLEQLDPAERAVAERASVVGRVFEAAAVNELADAALRPAVSASLLALVRKELVRPDRSELTAGDAFRFRHILIRDAAYAALPKAERAELHERFANWLERTAGERLAELEEIVGHHLEQAYRYRTELGETGEAVVALGQRAIAYLWPAAREALEWGDPRKAVGLLDRIRSLLPAASPDMMDLHLDLYSAHYGLGHREIAEAAFQAASDALRYTSRPASRHRLALVAAHDATGRPGSGQLEHYRQVSLTAIDAAERSSDDQLLGRGLVSLANVAALAGNLKERRAIMLRCVDLDRRLGRRSALATRLSDIANLLPIGPWPVEEALIECSRILEETGGHPEARATIFISCGVLEMFRGRLDEGRLQLAEAKHIADEIGVVIPLAAADWPMALGLAELLVGDPARAKDVLMGAIPTLQDAGDLGHLASIAPLAAQVLIAIGEADRAESFAELGRSVAADEDLDAQVRWRLAMSGIDAARGRIDQAVDHVTAARRRVVGSDYLILELEVELAAIAVGRRAKDPLMVDRARSRAIELATIKGSGPLLDRAQMA
jgi:hypothetical protein